MPMAMAMPLAMPMATRIPYRVWAYAVGSPQSQSIAAGAFKTLPTDLPAVLILCEDETDQARLIQEVYERGRTPDYGTLTDPAPTPATKVRRRTPRRPGDAVPSGT